MIEVEMRVLRGFLGLGSSEGVRRVRWPIVALVASCAVFWLVVGWWALG